MGWPAAIGAIGAAAISAFGGERRNSAQSAAAGAANALTSTQFYQNRKDARHGYRIAVKDMRLAGLNPILAAKYGPYTPPNGVPSYNVPNLENSIGTGITAGLHTAQSISDVRLKDAQERLTQANATLQEKLEPGADAISKITNAINGLLDLVADRLKEGTGGTEQALNTLSGKIGQLLDKGEQSQNDVKVIINNIDNYVTEKTEAVKSYWNEIRSQRENFQLPEE